MQQGTEPRARRLLENNFIQALVFQDLLGHFMIGNALSQSLLHCAQ